MTDNTEPTIDDIEQEITNIFITIDNYGTDEEARVDIRKLISDQVAKARIEETSLWYNEWGNGTDEIGDGSWEDYYAHRIQTLNGVKNK